jgi:hypothetical protein
MRGWARLGIGTAIVIGVGVSAWWFGPPHYTIEPDYTDHLKHAYDSWSFLQVGFDVFSEPVIEWEVRARHPHLLWEFWPHPYPIGAVLLFLPFGVASNLGWLPDLAVHWLMVTFLGVAAVWAARRFTAQRVGIAITIFVVGVFLHWGLNGFYDPLVAGLAVWAIDRYRRGDMSAAILLFTVALSLHYRLWYLAPLALAAAWNWYRQKGFDWRLAVAGTTAALSLVTFTMTRSAYGTLAGGEGLSLVDRLSSGAPFAMIGFGLVTAAVAWWERSFLVTSTVALAAVIAFSTPQFHDWYIILLAPLFVLLDDARSRGVFLVAWLHLATPSLIRLADFYAQAIT